MDDVPFGLVFSVADDGALVAGLHVEDNLLAPALHELVL